MGQPRGCPNGSINLLADVEVNQEACDDRLNAGRLEGVLGEPSLIGNDVEAEGVAGQIKGRRVSNGASSDSNEYQDDDCAT